MRALRVLLLSLAPVLAFAQKAAPQNPDDRLRAAETALEKNDLKAAAGLLARLAEERPHDAHVFFDLGYADEGLGDNDGARQAYRAAIAANPALGEAHIALGLLLARTGAAPQAETAKQLRTGAENTNTPAEVRGRALRALSSLEAGGEPALAAQDLLQAVQLTHETEPDMVASADLALASGDLDDAEKAYRRALEQQPDDVSAATGLGQTLRRANRLADADDVLTAALTKSPGDAAALAALAVVKVSENKSAEAITLLEPLVPAGSAARNPAIARELARLYVLTGDKTRAEALYVELAAAAPNDPALLDDYADVLVREAKFAPAEAVLLRAVGSRNAWKKPTDWAEAEGHLAFAASRNHHPEVALQALAARATVLPNSPAVLFLEATAHDSLRQNKEAVLAYKAFLAVTDGKFPDEEFEARHRVVALERIR